MIPLHLLTGALFGWLEHEPRDAIQFPRAENRVLTAQLHGRRMRLRDDDHRRLAVARPTPWPLDALGGGLRTL